MKSRGYAFAHELVIGRMELDLIAAETPGIESMEFRRIFIGAAAEREHLGGAPMFAERRQCRRFLGRAVRFDASCSAMSLPNRSTSS